MGMQEENQHSLQRKQGGRVRRKEIGSEESYGHICSFWKKKHYFEMWIIFIVALSSAAQQCDSVIHIKIYIFKLFFTWFITECWIWLLVLYSRTLLFFIPLFPQLPTSPTPHSSSWQPHVLALFDWWTLISPAAEKTPWYLPKEGNKTKNCARSGYWGELPVKARGDWCVSLIPPGF